VLALAALVVVLGVAGGGYALHEYRKEAAVTKALASGTAAYEAKDYTKAAFDLGGYLTANRRDVPVLLKYAHAQLGRRPRTGKNIEQAICVLSPPTSKPPISSLRSTYKSACRLRPSASPGRAWPPCREILRVLDSWPPR
jgi:hypothetical protein